MATRHGRAGGLTPTSGTPEASASALAAATPRARQGARPGPCVTAIGREGAPDRPPGPAREAGLAGAGAPGPPDPARRRRAARGRRSGCGPIRRARPRAGVEERDRRLVAGGLQGQDQPGGAHPAVRGAAGDLHPRGGRSRPGARVLDCGGRRRGRLSSSSSMPFSTSTAAWSWRSTIGVKAEALRKVPRVGQVRPGAPAGAACRPRRPSSRPRPAARCPSRGW